MKIDTRPQFLDKWRSITYSRFVLNMVKGHHLQHRCHPLLFCNFKWFSINDAAASLPVIQKKVDRLLTKSVMEQSTDGEVFTQMYLWFLSIHMVYDPYSGLRHSITTCTYLLLRCLLSDRYSNVFSKVSTRTLICIFLLLCLIIILYVLHGLSVIWYDECLTST